MFKSASLILLLLSFTAFSQQDFNRFTTLVSVGDIPADFYTRTYEKVETDLSEHRTGLSAKQERIFFEGIHYSIDEILQSNMVIFGDEISVYVKEVAAHLLKDEPSLMAKFRFYTLKSNETNAFSTEQGIIFVTTGLISQLSSEAQLAYVLAHEISHYTANHVIETFEWKSDNRSRQIQQMSMYSKEKEFEADKLAIDLYNKAGYAKSEIPATFDVLMYSYLPFDEVEFSKAYFNTDKLYVPAAIFSTKKYEIKADEDADDSNSSHPNIRKRKSAALLVYDELKTWEEGTNLLGEPRFNYVRNLARFESLRANIIDAEFTKAIYSIYLLEREFPQSLYLKRMKAQAWLGIAQFKVNSMTDAFRTTKNNEGEIAGLHQFLKKLDASMASVMALRIIYDLNKELPEDAEIAAIYDRVVKTCAETKKFDLAKFSAKTFGEASVVVRDTSVAADTLTVITAEPPKSSKYDRIRQKQTPEMAAALFDSTDFHLYALTDVLADPEFLKLYGSHKKAIEEKEREEEAFDALSRDERKKGRKLEKENQNRLGLSKLIIVEPSIVEYSHGRVDYVKSEMKEEKLTGILEDVSSSIDLDITNISSQTMVEKGTADFNDRSIFYSSIEQESNYKEIDFFPADFQKLQEIRTRRNTSHALFILAEHYYAPQINWTYTLLLSALILPIPVIYGVVIPVKLIHGHQTEITYLVLDLTKGQVSAGGSSKFHEQFNRHNIGAHMYTILTEIKSYPKP